MIKWNEVTWYSKLGAVIVLLGVVPVLSFMIGRAYEQAIDANLPPAVIQAEPVVVPVHATTATTTVPVVVEHPGTGTGTFTGTMTIGPLCPVQNPDHPCNPTAETYAAHPVYIYKTDRVTLVKKLIPDATGTFSTTLAVGSYWVDVTHSGVGSVHGLPQTVQIQSGATTHITVDIDTGIR